MLFCAQDDNTEAVFDCTRGGQNFVIAAHALGLGTRWVGAPMPWLAQAEVQLELGVPEGFVPAAAFTVGYAAEQPSGRPKPRPGVRWVGGD